MSRSGYSEGCEGWDLIRWRGAVTSAIKGARGQAFLQEMIVALDALPEKRLVENALQEESGGVCAMGAVGLKRGIDMAAIEADDRHSVSQVFGIAPALAAEIAYENDGDHSYWRHDTPEQRWQRMRNWAEEHLVSAG